MHLTIPPQLLKQIYSLACTVRTALTARKIYRMKAALLIKPYLHHNCPRGLLSIALITLQRWQIRYLPRQTRLIHLDRVEALLPHSTT